MIDTKGAEQVLKWNAGESRKQEGRQKQERKKEQNTLSKGNPECERYKKRSITE